ncbi:hypothetical protein ACL02R_04240 [Streptomyces sp. MS19]|uniref:hypothetical protein n=1 Tax=Streptomyces sp. MS19 TaxID=3385972 RepID=UPI00399F4789
MHRSIRLALPAVAAASALVLTGCGDDSEPPFGVGAEDIQMPDDSDLPDVPDPDVPDEEDVPDLPDFDEGDLGNGDAEGGYDGSWYVDPNDTGGSHNLDFVGSGVTFYEDLGAEGDVCHGTLTADTFTFTECSEFGTETWADMSATTVLNDDGTMTVVWESGLEETYTKLF